MAYDEESKIKAKKYVEDIRSKTVCKKCGKQPIEWHHKDHEIKGNERVAHLVALGFSIERIQREIDKCEALCRSCHMKEDGRLKKLQKNCPNQKGIKFPAKPCSKCNTLSKPLWKGMCRKCYDYKRRHK